jgi:hypothetical protein
MVDKYSGGRDEVFLMKRGNPESSATAGKAEGGAALGSEKMIGLGKKRLANESKAEDEAAPVGWPMGGSYRLK